MALGHYHALVKQAKELGITKRLKKAALIKAIIAAGGQVAPAGKTTTSEAKTLGYVTPGAIKCPRCGAADTKATSTRGRVQYRICRRGTCRRRFHIVRELRGEK
jgi:hypothetical protein